MTPFEYYTRIDYRVSCHVPPTPVPTLKKVEFSLMTGRLFSASSSQGNKLCFNYYNTLRVRCGNHTSFGPGLLGMRKFSWPP